MLLWLRSDALLSPPYISGCQREGNDDNGDVVSSEECSGLVKLYLATGRPCDPASRERNGEADAGVVGDKGLSDNLFSRYAKGVIFEEDELLNGIEERETAPSSSCFK